MLPRAFINAAHDELQPDQSIKCRSFPTLDLHLPIVMIPKLRYGMMFLYI